MFSEFTVPVILSVPAVVEEVKVAEYVPSKLSVTDPSEPKAVGVMDSVTASPPVVILFPNSSFKSTVMVEVLTPSFKITVGEAVIVEVVSDAAPAPTVKLLLVPNSEPDELVAVIVQFPTLSILTVCDVRTPEEKLAVVPCPEPIVQLDEITTVPLKEVTVVADPSTPVILMLNDCPADLELMFPEGTRSITNSVRTPSLTILKGELNAEVRPALVACNVSVPIASILRSSNSAIPSALVFTGVVPESVPDPPNRLIPTDVPDTLTALPY